jgi:uncharacterized protein
LLIQLAHVVGSRVNPADVSRRLEHPGPPLRPGHDGCRWEETERWITQVATSARSTIHGPAHWRSVALAGAMICKHVPEADLLTVLLFAVTHDACRLSDDDDPEHGHRAAAALDALLPGWVDELKPWRRSLLEEACKHHADGFTTEDQTIGACWDADRLCLWRGDTEPDPSMMSTAPGRSRELIGWSRDLHLREVRWRDVAAIHGDAALHRFNRGTGRAGFAR